MLTLTCKKAAPRETQ